ncbi:unnamed protein product [Cuscuta europaea]|uniref:Peroxidase n=1 Tax=Cuscuta europaea TaxID=41803 RepID=A0A9P0Z0I1_CUSEU|nr:unnamed protein product [Cuscuta europaea]
MNERSYIASTMAWWFCFLFFGCLVYGQLDYHYYDSTCPSLTRIVKYTVWSAIANETRMAASLLRLHFHDCIVNGCDGSVLLEGGEKLANPNKGSLRGFEVIDTIKANVEKVCPSTVSCTDILTLAAREATTLAGGPCWKVPFGRRDGLTTSEAAANDQVPSPFEPLENITAKFFSKGLDIKDVVILSGAHTIGFARCSTFKQRLFDFDGHGNPDASLDASMLSGLRIICAQNQTDSDSNLAPLDSVTTNKFDNVYYKNLLNNTGLLQSDQVLATNDKTSELVLNYSRYPYLFMKDFATSMEKLGNVGVLTGKNGEIRKNCRVVN